MSKLYKTFEIEPGQILGIVSKIQSTKPYHIFYDFLGQELTSGDEVTAITILGYFGVYTLIGYRQLKNAVVLVGKNMKTGKEYNIYSTSCVIHKKYNEL